MITLEMTHITRRRLTNIMMVGTVRNHNHGNSQMLVAAGKDPIKVGTRTGSARTGKGKTEKRLTRNGGKLSIKRKTIGVIIQTIAIVIA